MSEVLAPSPENIILGKGELFFDRYDANDVSTGYFHLGNCSKFGIALNDDVITMFSNMSAAAGIYKKVTRRREVNIEITAHEMAMANLALAMMGDQGTFSQSGATITETLTPTVTAGHYYQTAKRSTATATTVSEVRQGTSTWTVGVDYFVVDPKLKLIQVAATPSTAVTTGATPVTITYNSSTLSLPQIFAATNTKIEGKLLFVPDPTTGPQFDVEVWRASVTPGGQVGFISDDFGEYTLTMAAIDESAGVHGGSASCPFFRLIERGTT